MIKAGIIGATGYAGAELARILLQRDDVEIVWYGSRSFAGREYPEIFGNLYNITDKICKDDNMEELSDIADIIFTATPQGFAAENVSEDMLKKCRVIDLSADFRIGDRSEYESWYGIEHKAEALLGEAVYGLCELNRERIKQARLIANPGCYSTCSILTVYPLLKAGLIDEASIIIDAKSGTSGAGRGASTANLFCEVNENISAYKVASHRHTPEIEEQLSIIAGKDIKISFTPHLVPMMRGILVTAYAALKPGADRRKVREAYESCYAEEKFIRVLKEDIYPHTGFVKGSNYVDVNAVVDERTGRVIMLGAMDNLVKGAAGQAVQNMNIMFGLPEDKGLCQLPIFP